VSAPPVEGEEPGIEKSIPDDRWGVDHPIEYGQGYQGRDQQKDHSSSHSTADSSTLSTARRRSI